MPTTRLIRPQYTVQFTIGQIDLTMRLQSIAIINSIKSVYPTILLKIGISSKDYFLNQIYGQEDAKLSIIVTAENSVPTETTNLELIIIHMDNKVSMQKNTEDGGNESQQIEDTITAVALVKSAYNAFSTTVNYIFNSDKNSDGNKPTNEISRLRDFMESGFNVVNGLENVVNNGLGFINNTVNNVNNVIDSGYEVVNNTTGRVQQILDYNINDFGGFGKASVGSGGIKVVKDTVKKISLKTGKSINSQNFNKTSLSDSLSDNTYADGTTLFGPVEFSGEPGSAFVADPPDNLYSDGTPIFGTPTYFNSSGRDPLSIAHAIIQSFAFDIEKNISMDNKNTVELTQLVIPPRSLVGAIRYLNDRYGLYKGPMLLYCGIDNILNMWDLSKASSQEVLYTVDFLSQGADDTEIMRASSDGDSHFYTYFPLKVKNKTNTSLMSKGYEHIISKSPRNSLFQTIKMNIEDVVKDLSMSTKPSIICNASAKKKKTVHSIGVSGTQEDSDNAFITSKLSQFIASSSMFTFRLKGSKLPLKKLSKVGSCIELIPHVTEYLPYSGKYVVGSSAIILSREQDGNYMCNAEITCFRESLES